jgi:hypothetical protein
VSARLTSDVLFTYQYTQTQYILKKPLDVQGMSESPIRHESCLPTSPEVCARVKHYFHFALCKLELAQQEHRQQCEAVRFSFYFFNSCSDKSVHAARTNVADPSGHPFLGAPWPTQAARRASASSYSRARTRARSRLSGWCREGRPSSRACCRRTTRCSRSPPPACALLPCRLRPCVRV